MADSRPPTPTGLPLLGNAVAFARDPFAFTLESVSDVGDAFRIDLPVGDRYILATPTYAERVLVSERDAFEKTEDFRLAFGNSVIAVEDGWQEQREFLNPFFFAREIQSSVPTMAAQIRRRADGWDDGQVLDTVDQMKGLTFDVFSATVLGLDPASNDDDLRHAADDLNGYFEPVTWALPDWIPTPSRRRFEAAKTTLRRELRALLDDRSGEQADVETIFDALAQGLLADDDTYPRSEEAAIDQLIGLVFAGHETTALALTYTLYCLCENPEVYRQVETEIDEVVGDEPVEWEHLDEFDRLERVIDETLRLYPPVHAIPRKTTRPVELDEGRLPEDAEVLVSIYAIHRDERYWENAETFDPSRWRRRDRSENAYLPFGAGPRRCLGATFARIEAQVALAELLQRFRFEWVGDGDLSLSPQMTTQPSGSVPLRVRRR